MLVVGLNSDESIRSLKGNNRPVISFEDRKRSLESLRFVDLVVKMEEQEPSDWIRRISPRVVTKGFFGKNTWTHDNMPEWGLCVSLGIEVAFIDSPVDISTTRILERLRRGKDQVSIR